MPTTTPEFREVIRQNVSSALAEDIGTGDITALLISENTQGKAQVITREAAVLCGEAWVNETFRQLDEAVQLRWLAHDGDTLSADQPFLYLEGNLRSLLTGERTALNFLQLLSGTATTARALAAQIAHTSVTLLDTRKTIPGLRIAQKYAVRTGGCSNHRMGLYDAFLIKENHIVAAGGDISAAVQRAHCTAPGKSVEVEVENIDELLAAIAAKADIIMLDDFPIELIRDAVKLNAGRAKLEVSGSVTADDLTKLANTGIDFISMGALTKHCRAIDLSMRITQLIN